jgi:LmbE family N-acetylglucosaminyl deacetylase
MKETKPKALSIWAHADDSAWIAGGTIARLTQIMRVDGLLFTDSNGQGVGKQRLREERNAMEIMGMKELYPVGDELKLEDGTLSNRHFASMLKALLEVIDTQAKLGSPYTELITFGLDGYSGHIDHVVSAMVAMEAFRTKPQIERIWQAGMKKEERELWGEYFVPVPVVDLTDYQKIDITSTYLLKIAAIKAHESQMSNGGSKQVYRVENTPRHELFKITSR